MLAGVQIVTLFSNLLKTKLIANYGDTSGMGIFGLLNSTCALLTTFLGFGISYSAVKFISEAVVSKNNKASIILALLILSLLFGFLGVLFLFNYAGYFSFQLFGNGNYATDIKILSFCILCNLLYDANKSILQGTQQIGKLAKLNLFAALIAIPIYIFLFSYNFQHTYVVAILSVSFFGFIVSGILVKDEIKLSSHMEFYNSKFYMIEMLKLGFVLSLSVQIGAVTTNTLNLSVRAIGGLSEFGKYSAGLSMITSYVGLIFNTLTLDYYPRLTKYTDSHRKMSLLINRQGVITILLITPLLIAMILFLPLIIRVLLSENFVSASNFINLLIIGMLFKSATYPVGLLSFAKGDKKLFFWFEAVINNVIYFTLTYFFYQQWGLNGAGVAFLLNYILYFFVVINIAKKRYFCYLSQDYYKIFAVSLMLIFLAFVLVNLDMDIITVRICGVLLMSVSLLLSAVTLFSRTGIKTTVDCKGKWIKIINS